MVARAVAATIHSHLAPRVNLYAFCVMPDHVHLLSMTQAESQLTVIGEWKQVAHFTIRRVARRGAIWQRASYDVGVVSEGAHMAVAEYIVNNPVRRGLVRDWTEYTPLAWHAWMPATE